MNSASAYHTRILTVPIVLFLSRCPPDTLRLVQTEQTVVKLPHNAVRGQEVVEEPLLAEYGEVCAEDGRGVRPEGIRLIDRDQDILHLE